MKESIVEEKDRCLRPVVLTLVAYYLPGYKSGGPVRTIANMVEHLGDHLDFRIITADRDSFDTRPYPGVRVNAWNEVGKAQVYYAAPSSLSFFAIRRLILDTPHDVLYLNSFFTARFTVLPLLVRKFGGLPYRPTVLAPRGEFSGGALALKSWKKQLYIRASRLLGLYGNLNWQASSAFEAEDIKRMMGSVARSIQNAPDLSAPVTQSNEEKTPLLDDLTRPLRVVFLSRISPKKNLDFALQVLETVAVPVKFNIYGLADDEAHWQYCQELMTHLPGHITATYHGLVHHDDVAKVLMTHDLFFLPTRGENFGHAIFEALAAGVPPLISDQTPWQDLDEAGVGWVRPLNDASAFKGVVEQLAQTSPVERIGQRQRARQYARNLAENSAVMRQNLDLFFNACRQGARP